MRKIGHAGTLDPMATGVLPLAFGEATKTIRFMQDLEKKFQEIAKIDEETFFRDYALHKYLENEIQKTRLLPDSLDYIPYYSNEFFTSKPADRST